MNKTTKIFLLFLLATSKLSLAKIVQSNTVNEICQHIEKQQAAHETLIVFDIDDVIATTKGYKGSTKWFDGKINKFVSKGHTFLDSVNLVMPSFTTLQFKKDLKKVDKNAPKLISELIKNGHTVIALTNRSTHLSKRTVKQLAKLGVRFCDNLIQEKRILLDMHCPCIFKKGIIFMGENQKGPSILAFLKKFQINPKKIIFIDDKLKHVDSVESTLKSANIDHVCIHYKAQSNPK